MRSANIAPGPVFSNFLLFQQRKSVTERKQAPGLSAHLLCVESQPPGPQTVTVLRSRVMVDVISSDGALIPDDW